MLKITVAVYIKENRRSVAALVKNKQLENIECDDVINYLLYQLI